MKNYEIETPAGPAVARRSEGWMKRIAKKGGALAAMAGLTIGLAAAQSGPTINTGRQRVALPEATHSQVGRPLPKANNPMLEGVSYVYRQDLYSPYQVATGSALNIQQLFTPPKGTSYTPSGGTAYVLSFWHTNMTQFGLLSNPDMFNLLFMSLSTRGDIYVNDLNRFTYDSLLTVTIGNQTPYGIIQGFRVPAGGGNYGASSGTISNGFPAVNNQYEFETTMVDGVPESNGGRGEIFPGSGLAGPRGEILTQQQNIAVTVNPTLVIDANGLTTYTTSASGVGITAFVHLRGQYCRQVQG